MGEFFTKVPTGFQVNKQIRELCVFSVHNLLNDSPFSKMDLISCRNVLVPYLQRKALTIFHYALNPMGYLLLGKSETSSSVPNLFTALVKNERLFKKKDVPGKIVQLSPYRNDEVMQNKIPDPNAGRSFTDFQKTADEIVLSRYSPAAVVVNEALDILHFRGGTSVYLEQASGKPSHNLIKMARPGLAFELRNLMHKVIKDKAQTIKENIAVQLKDIQHIVDIEAIPLPNMIEPHYLVLFHENSRRPVAKSSHADINFSALCSADIISFQFEQLFSNLISNSIKFRNPEKLLKIDIGSEIVEGNKLNNELLLKYKQYCHVTYEDNGIGFEPAFNAKVFELFQRLHGKDEFPGTGIGLSIVKKIVENHEGVITASGVLNKGVKFDIYIPVLHLKTNIEQV